MTTPLEKLAVAYATITAEQVCAQMYPATWAGSDPKTRELSLRNAERHLDAIRALAAQGGGK